MRDVNTLKGLHGLRTLHSAKKRSIPRIQSSAYLDLYMMSKEKERLLKEGERLGLRNDVIKKRLEKIDGEMGKMQEQEEGIKATKDVNSPKRVFTQTSEGKKEWKKMSLDY